MKQNDPLLAAQNLCKQGIALAAEDKREESLAAYAQVVAQYGHETSPPYLQVLATAMFNRATTLGILNRNEEAVSAYDKLIEKFDVDAYSQFSIYIVKAMMNKAYRLNTLLKNDEAIATYQTVVNRFGSTDDGEMRPLVDSVKSFLAQRNAALEARALSTQNTLN